MNVSIVFLVRYVKHRHITERLRESIEIFNAHFKQRCYFLLGDVTLVMINTHISV